MLPQVLKETGYTSESSFNAMIGGKAADFIDLHHEHILVAVVVEIEDGDARRDDLGVIEFARHAVEVREVQTRACRLISEPRLRRLRCPSGRKRRERQSSRDAHTVADSVRCRQV